MGLFNCMGSRRAGLEELVGASPAGLGGPAALRCGVKAEVWGSWRVGRRCWLCCHPHVAQFLQKSRSDTRRGRGTHRLFFFFFLFTLGPQGWRRLERGAAAPSKEGCLSPGWVSEGLPQPLIAFSR